MRSERIGRINHDLLAGLSDGTGLMADQTVGASGAVFGLFAALFIIQRRFGRDTSAIVGLLVLNLAISFIGANISWQGHLGGLVTGAIVAALYAWAPRNRRTVYGVCGTVAITIALIGVICLRAALA